MLGAFLFPTLLAITIPQQAFVVSAQKTNFGASNFSTQSIISESSQSGSPVCLKMRVYQFERNDGMAPKLVRETTCTTTRPFLHQSKAPKARLIPAN